MNISIILAFITYFSIILLIGIVFHKKQSSSSDYIMGNRSLNFWLVALSAHASDMSAWLFMSFPMAIFLLGLPRLWIAVGLLVGMFLNWQFVAKKLRSMTEKYDCYTLSSFFEKRFEDSHGWIRTVSAFAMVIFLTHYLSAGFIAMGNLLESIFEMNYFIGLSMAVFVVLCYTFIGGFNTVAWVDLFQGIFLMLVIVFVPFVAYQKIEGWSAIAKIAEAKNIPLTFLGDFNTKSIITTLSLVLGWGLGYFGMPHIITKFMGIKDPDEMYKSKWLGISWQFITLLAAAAIGLIAIAYFPGHVEKPEMIFIEMVKDLFHPYTAGFILCAVIAANMSTMDSQILVCGSILSGDLYKHFYPLASDRKILFMSKMSVVMVSLVALFFAFNRSATILDTVEYSWSGLGSAFGPLVLMSLYSKTANRYGALAGIIVGTIVVMVWPHLGPKITNYPIVALVPGFFASALAIYVVSHYTKKLA